MTVRGALLSFRIQRFETTIIVGAAILSVAVSVLLIWLYNSPGFAQCHGDDQSSLGSVCQTGIFPWLNRAARLSLGIVPVFPIVAGLLAGGPIVARELENGTARLAWSLGPSRIRWFIQRAGPIILMVAAAGLAIGLIAEALTHLLQPTTDLDQSFIAFRARGLLVAVQAVLVAAIALAFGAILGRSVPTLVLSLILVGAVGLAVDKIEREVLTNEALMASGNDYYNGSSDSNLYLDSRLRFPDGTIATWQEAYALHPEIQFGYDETSGISDVVLYIPGARYHDIERREALVLLVLAAGFAGLAGIAVVRRRPR
jgi:hypothetical protein